MQKQDWKTELLKLKKEIKRLISWPWLENLKK